MRRRVSSAALLVLLPVLAYAAASDTPEAAASRLALTDAARLVAGPVDAVPPERPSPMWADGLPSSARAVVVGFTGGVERHDSRASGVVRMREGLAASTAADHLVSVTYNNFRWRRAATEVIALVRDGQPDDGPADQAQPLVVVYGHSLGAGSIAKFARRLRDEGLEISLAVYIDAIAFRNPRVPDNIHYAVNFYQRTGLLRGLPLRGKRTLVAEASEATTILGSYPITPETDRFGWNWNLIQPLLYRHHHRISHDVRLQGYLIDALAVLLEATAAPDTPAALVMARDQAP